MKSPKHSNLPEMSVFNITEEELFKLQHEQRIKGLKERLPLLPTHEMQKGMIIGAYALHIRLVKANNISKELDDELDKDYTDLIGDRSWLRPGTVSI